MWAGDALELSVDVNLCNLQEQAVTIMPDGIPCEQVDATLRIESVERQLDEENRA
jgi:hypothetical protein